MNQRTRIALLGSGLYFRLVAGAAITLGALGACIVRGGIDLTPPRVVIGPDAASSRPREIDPPSREDGQAFRENRQPSPPTDLRTSSPAAQRVVDIWKEDLGALLAQDLHG